MSEQKEPRMNERRGPQDREVFETMPVPRALASLALPTIMGQLITLIYNMADTFFIGRTADPMKVAGVSLILPVFNISMVLANLVGLGGGAVISRMLGAGRDRDAGRVSAFSFYLSLGFAACFSVGVLAGMRPLLTLLGASAQTYGYARQYTTCVIVLGAVPTVTAMTLAHLLRSVGCAKQAGTGISMGGLINIALDPLLMFVILPKGMEIVGAGMATMLSNCIVCAYFTFVLRRLRGRTALSFSPHAGLPERRDAAAVFATGIPSAVAAFLFDADYVVIDRLATGYGDIPLAAIGIVLKTERLPLNVGIGLCQGMMPLAAYNYSAGNTPRMKKVVSTARLAGLAVAAASILMYEMLAGQIMRVFIDNTETVAIGSRFLRIRVLATPLMFLCFHMVYLFQALGRGERALLLGMARWLVFNIPMLFILNRLIGMYGIVWSQFAADILTVAFSYMVYFHFEKTVLRRQTLS